MKPCRNFVLIFAVGLLGCGQSTNGGSGAGGASSQGGASTSSGGTSAAGAGGSAGKGGSGGTTTAMTGGAVGGGGTKATGGTSAMGGSTAVGGNGTGGKGTGGTAAGGNAGGGGVAGTGGGSGGVTGNGGVAGAGGSTGGGGTTAMGGRTFDGGLGGSATGGARDGGGTGGTGALTGGSTGGGGSAAGGATGAEASFIPDPGWACGMTDGIPPPTKGTLAFSISLQISATHEVGNTPYGKRRLLDVKGGTITGDKLKGSVVTGGLEYELTLSNGVVEYQGINILKASDGAMIYVRSCGVAPDGSTTPRVIPGFEATTSGSYAFLNTGKFVATRVLNATGGSGTLQLDVYDVSKVTVGDPRIQITKPSGVPKQPWECNTTTGTKGASVFTENVSLGSSISIANAKNGSRNIIPITGGTTTGQVAGAILNGGADYQLSGSLDAWYTLAPSNGEFILVRNCGPMGKLIPWFEARTDGTYNFLNTSAFLSSDPGSGSGGVSITFYERK
jgi:hypothetical protein